jgi:NADPH:quinone reductase-like Zn-dependent oxidoreductase
MPLTIIPSLIPGSDGSGRILAIGSAVASARPDLKTGVDGAVLHVFLALYLLRTDD